MKMTNYHWIFVGGAVSLIGTIIVLYFTFKQNESSSKRNQRIEGNTTDIKFQNEELLQKNSELRREVDKLRIENLTLHLELRDETKIINDNITGGKSIPYIEVKLQENPTISSFYLNIIGENNLQNLKFTNLNISQIERFHKSYPEDLVAARSKYLFITEESLKKYISEKSKSYQDLSIIKQGNFLSKSEKYIGNQGYFSGSTKGVITAILIEASNGNYYHLFNWGLVENFYKLPTYNILIEDILFDEAGNIVKSNLRKEDWFYYKDNKFRKLETISFDKVKYYFEEKQKSL